MKSAIGQVSDTLFVYRLYEESGVRFRLVNIVDPSDSDVVVGHAVDCRVGVVDINKELPIYFSQVFGASHEQFLLATESFAEKVTAFITKGLLPCHA